VNGICICTAGEVDDDIISLAAELTGGRVLPDVLPVAGAWDNQRQQYNSFELLKAVAARRPADASRILGLTACDLFVPVLSFVFGQAQLGGAAALVSVARLNQTFYGLPPRRSLLWDRVVKTVLHELGHTCGLVHCTDRTCAMALATNVAQLDAKEPRYCESCRALMENNPCNTIGKY
jgi:archaemetzincin